ncbi:MAG: porin family protein [Tunicatimonas sp.]
MKNVLIMSALVLSVSYASAQVAVNPKIGVNLSRITSENVQLSDEGVRAGFNAGLDFRIGAEDGAVFFQPGLHYYNIGANFTASVDDDDEGGDFNLEDDISVHSLRVPLNVGVYLTGAETAVRVRLNGGVTPSFILGVGDNDVRVTSDDFQSVNWGLNGGLGFDFTIVTLDFGYEHGLNQIVNSIDQINLPDVNGRNRLFTVSLGIVL